ncbi:hypothetical protein Bca52824_023398 [Brassica carinata]|uniref:Uncharacterized protein n=1 Tax=Brassica carinata TaxID=52824 RepID=A0A8X7VIN6_BRACI|nr:hypothetical protein Bca52824_023398 [Brassica carinata]
MWLRKEMTEGLWFLFSHGYHVVAPDFRYCIDSDSPTSHESYTLSHLVADVISLFRSLRTAHQFF